MNPFKNISVFRNQQEEYSKGNLNYYNSQLTEIELLKEENNRLHHLTNVLIDHIWKTGDKKLPLKEIDRQMKIYDDGGIDGTPRNT